MQNQVARTKRAENPVSIRKCQHQLQGAGEGRVLFETRKLMPIIWKISFQKPKAPASPSMEEEPCLAFPKPPVDPAKIRRISSARARLFRAASQGALLPDRTLPPAECKAGWHPLESGGGRVFLNWLTNAVFTWFFFSNPTRFLH